MNKKAYRPCPRPSGCVWDTYARTGEHLCMLVVCPVRAHKRILPGSRLALPEDDESGTKESTAGGGCYALTQELEALQAEYAEAEQAAYNSLTSQFGLFNTMTVEVDTSVSDMIGSLDSQIAFMDKYADNMRRASELGIDEGLLQELSDGSVESAKYLQAIVDDGG